MDNGNKISIEMDFFWIGLIVLFILFSGEPDIVDAVIYKLMH